jgi:hypothetical protein
VASQSPWLSVTAGASRVGSASFTFAYEANPLAAPRVGSLLVAGYTFQVNQAGVTCAFTLGSTAAAVESGGGAVSVPVGANAIDCAWTAASQVPWITVTAGTAGTGAGTVQLAIAPNALSATRIGTVSIGGQTFSVTQAGVTCSYQVTPSAAGFGAPGGGGEALVTANAADCAWQSTTTTPWLSTVGPAGGTGHGVLRYAVAANPLSATRTGGFTIGGQTLAITQTGVACAFALQPSAVTASANGGTVQTTLVASAADCAWAVTGRVAWLQPSPGAGAGTRAVDVAVAANGDVVPRAGTVTLGGQTLIVNQSARGSEGVQDVDNDTLPDAWEQRFGLSTTSGAGDDGPQGDPDRDGSNNLGEFVANTHPRGFFTRYLAEGATGGFFSTALALANPGARPASVLLRFLRNDSVPTSTHVAVPAMSRRTLAAGQIQGLETAEFSTIIESDEPVAADRTMSWDRTGYGDHAETTVDAPGRNWYLAEGATADPFELFYLLQNPTREPSRARVRFVLPGGQAIDRFYDVPAGTRVTIWVDRADPALAANEVAAIVDVVGGAPIIVERAMYLNRPGLVFSAGHESAAAAQTSERWHFAEGATGPFFDTFLLVFNPTDRPALVRFTYLLTDGREVVRTREVGPMRRATVWVDVEDPLLANAGFAASVESANGVPVVAERSMWWPGPSAASWNEAHNVVGSVRAGTSWALAGVESGGPAQSQTYVLVGNLSPFGANLSITALFDDGRPPMTRSLGMRPRSRLGFNAADLFPEARNRSFSVLVQSLGQPAAELVVERATYGNARGVGWASGAASRGTLLAR